MNAIFLPGCSVEDFLRILETHDKQLGIMSATASWTSEAMLVHQPFLPWVSKCHFCQEQGPVRVADSKICPESVATGYELSTLQPQPSLVDTQSWVAGADTCSLQMGV